jgi:hypothetical protein
MSPLQVSATFVRGGSSLGVMKPMVAPLALALLVAGTVLNAQEQPAPADPVIELPKFVVTDSRELPQPESWRYATIPGFEILTNASDRATQRLMRDFGMFRQALGHVWPIPQRLSQTTSLIICGKGNKFDSFIPAGKVVDAAFASVSQTGAKTAIVIDLEATTLNILNIDNTNDAATGTDSGMISVEHDKQLYREYVRYLPSQNDGASAWMEEGSPRSSEDAVRSEVDRIREARGSEHRLDPGCDDGRTECTGDRG